MNQPRISVLLPSYNSGDTLGDAIASVLAQSFGDFELLVLDDGSAQPASAPSDPRIAVLRSDRNLGLSRQLNLGIDRARGEFIARLDADDIAHPQRFEQQLAFLLDHPEIGICGSQAQLFDAGGEREIWDYPTSPQECHATLFLRSCFLHPGVMIRTSILREYGLRYDESYAVAQDYELWFRLLEVTRGANLPACLTSYRVSDSQLTRAHSETKTRETRQIRERLLGRLGVGGLDLYERILSDEWEESATFYAEVAGWLNKVQAANNLFPEPAFGRLLAEMFFARCQCASRRGFDGLAAYQQLDFARHFRSGPAARWRMRVKSILKPALTS